VIAVLMVVVLLFLVTPLWQAWTGAALAVFLCWLGLHANAYPEGLPDTVEVWLLGGVVALAVNGVWRGRRRDRLEQERRRLGKL
jgi:hypothetical protein